MTTPVKGRSLTTPQVVRAAPQSIPTQARIIHPPAPKISWRTRAMRWSTKQHRAHPFMWWCSVIAICLAGIRTIVALCATWPVFQGYFLAFIIFWVTCIGMLPITAIARSGQNIMEDIFK